MIRAPCRALEAYCLVVCECEDAGAACRVCYSQHCIYQIEGVVNNRAVVGVASLFEVRPGGKEVVCNACAQKYEDNNIGDDDKRRRDMAQAMVMIGQRHHLASIQQECTDNLR